MSILATPPGGVQAYFKMDNVLIDDRRIHVDFSQSVSKYRWKGKGRLEVLDENAPGMLALHTECLLSLVPISLVVTQSENTVQVVCD